MNIFEKKFMVLLEQPVPEVPAVVADPNASEIVPASPAGEPTTGAETAQALDQSPTPDNPVLNYKKEQSAQMTSTIQQWITQIGDFNQFLNGLDTVSMQAQLNNADCDTLFADVSRSETKKISRVAQDLSALVESLKGYLLSAEDNTQQ
jgi:hypothetical protein